MGLVPVDPRNILTFVVIPPVLYVDIASMVVRTKEATSGCTEYGDEVGIVAISWSERCDLCLFGIHNIISNQSGPPALPQFKQNTKVGPRFPEFLNVSRPTIDREARSIDDPFVYGGVVNVRAVAGRENS